MLTHAEHTEYTYLRPTKKFPNVWCAGCGIGIVMGALIRAIDRIGLQKDDVALVSGIATGLKIAKPELKVIAIMGDGDALAIGGNHFIHAARRNIGITAIVVNNAIYGMTGGQYSPTTPVGAKAATAPYGNIEPPMPICELAKAAGATYVARSTVYHAIELDRFIEQAILKNGFSLVEAVSYCPTTFGRLNKLGTTVDMMRQLKENSVSASAAEKLTPEARQKKIVRGVMHDTDKPEYTQLYEQLIHDVQEAEKAKVAKD
jgi:2-oxoglutarate ferredoxin oxidoreductase subunit beta